jgi:hypothetical protein
LDRDSRPFLLVETDDAQGAWQMKDSLPIPMKVSNALPMTALTTNLSGKSPIRLTQARRSRLLIEGQRFGH